MELSNKHYNIINTIIAIIVVLIAIGAWIFPFNNEKRALDIFLAKNIDIKADSPVYGPDLLELTFKGKKVYGLVSTKIRLQNSGTEFLKEADFNNGISILFPKNFKVVSFTFNQVQPEKDVGTFSAGLVKFDGSTTSNRILLIPKLLNPGDIYDLNVITIQNDDLIKNFNLSDIKFDYQIYGISKINFVPKIDTNKEKSFTAQVKLKKLIIPVLIELFLVILLFILGYYRRSFGSRYTFPYKNFLIIFTGLPLLFIIYQIVHLLINAYFLEL